MKVLLSVFECDPYKGSDSYVGWSYAASLSQIHEVYAITRIENRQSIESYLSQYANNNLHFIFVKRSKLFSHYLYKVNKYLGFLGSYYIWQKAAYREAVNLSKDIDIDVCHHVSIADFRVAGKLWKIGKPFIFGPVGGGQETPECLSEYIIGHEKEEMIRTFLNRIMTSLPSYKSAIRHASIIFSSNDETTNCFYSLLKEGEHMKVVQLTELCISDNYLEERSTLEHLAKNSVHIIVSGRLIYRKGLSLLLDAISKVKTHKSFEVQIYGEGDQKEELEKKSRLLGIESKVTFYGKVSYDEMQKKYREADIYILPSLRESTGTAVFEAMANYLPVIALKQNGVKYIVEDDSGILIPIQDKHQIIQDMANAIDKLVENRDLRIELGKNGYQKIKEKYTWSKRSIVMSGYYKDLVLRSIK